MPCSRFPSLVVLIGVAAAAATAGQSPQTRQWPPEVQSVQSQSPTLPAEEALKTFYLPPGYRVELVAAEPLVQEPVALDWDTQGRLWVVEMPGWMPDITAAGEHEPIGRVVVLEDTNADGRMDRRTVFADQLILARSLKVLDRGVLVGEPPNAWLMRDTTGDLRADVKELVTNEYGRREVDPQNNANGFDWSLDNTMHTAGQSDIQLRLENGRIQTYKTLRRGEWGVTHDDAGRVYRNTNESALHVDYVPTAYYARNPNLLRTRGSYDRLADHNSELNVVWPVRPNPGTNRAYQTGIDRPDGTLARFTSVCAPVVYRGDRLPPDLSGNVFVAEPAANLVSRIVLEADTTALRARKGYERGEFLASTDERFRPVYISSAPDGTLYVADLYRGIIEHRISITMYLRDHILSHRLEAPTGLGRIYRIVHDTTERDLSTGLSSAPPAKLVETLAHPNGWWRDTAQRLLVERRETSMTSALTALATGATDWRTRLHALWTLDGIGTIEAGLVTKALGDRSSDVRAAAVRIAERWLASPDHPIQKVVLDRVNDPAWSVRHQLAASLGVLPPGAREAAIAGMLERHALDPIVLDAGLSGLRGHERAVLDRIIRSASDRTAEGEASITMLAATIVRSAEEASVQDLFNLVADNSRTEWHRSAVLRGAEVALLGAPMPGATRAAARGQSPAAATPVPCPTCPGGRAGPGGAYAFPRPDGWPASTGRGAGPSLRLTREPVHATALALSDQDLGARVKNLMTRVTWPGKAGDAAAVAPLSAAEQKRFDLGREVYRNVCQSCHQPDGRGQDRLAPSLIGSVVALASPDIPARVLLNGKEGPTGLMPPIGASLNDEQVASVLTYVRREWGQTGAPVPPETIATIRKLTADRARPWTDGELMKLPTFNQATGKSP